MTELGRRFLEEYVPTHCKPSTQGEYRRSVELFIDPAIGEMRISEVERMSTPVEDSTKGRRKILPPGLAV